MKTETIAIIPARGGSKGVPRKNVLPLVGKPLIAHTIEAAQRARTVTRVVVSTDDAEIAQIAERWKAEVVWRPVEISGDSASSEAALLHVLDHLEQKEGYNPDLLVFLQCTSPLTTAADIDDTVDALHNEGADTSLAVTPFHYFLWDKDEDGDAVGINHDKRRRLLRQERKTQYLETGAVYVMRVPGFREVRHRFFGRTAWHVIPPERRLEIDEPVDFQVAEVLLRQIQKSESATALPDPIEALVMDFDGVFTDNHVVVFQDGREAVICDRGDGMGLSHLRRSGLPMLVLSTEVNPVVSARCAKLQIPCLQGFEDKLPVLLNWLKENRIDPAHTVYLGNDINDIECLQAVGCGIVVGDAYPEARAAARLVLNAPGGQRALRELTELIGQRRAGKNPLH